MPALWLIAGPNGSGKSTLARQLQIEALLPTPEEQDFLWINPDVIRAEIAAAQGEAETHSMTAAEAADLQFRQAIRSRRSFVRETVLSTERLFADLRAAKEAGYRLGLIYIFLRSPDLSIARVKARVAVGGHDVPEDKVRGRWGRSLAVMPNAVAMCDAALVFDNSVKATPGSTPFLVFEKTPNTLWMAANLRRYAKSPAPLRKALDRLATLAST